MILLCLLYASVCVRVCVGLIVLLSSPSWLSMTILFQHKNSCWCYRLIRMEYLSEEMNEFHTNEMSYIVYQNYLYFGAFQKISFNEVPILDVRCAFWWLINCMNVTKNVAAFQHAHTHTPCHFIYRNYNGLSPIPCNSFLMIFEKYIFKNNRLRLFRIVIRLQLCVELDELFLLHSGKKK